MLYGGQGRETNVLEGQGWSSGSKVSVGSLGAELRAPGVGGPQVHITKHANQ